MTYFVKTPKLKRSNSEEGGAGGAHLQIKDEEELTETEGKGEIDLAPQSDLFLVNENLQCNR